MAASITVHLQIFKRPQLLRFSTDIDETGIKTHGLLRSFILNTVIIRVAIHFKGVQENFFQPVLRFSNFICKLNPYPANIFCLENVVCLLHVGYMISNATQKTLTMVAN